MIDQKTTKRSRKTRSITSMPQADFVEGWQALVGEPPSIMLDDRRDMISILVQTTEVAPPYGPHVGPRGRPAAAESSARPASLPPRRPIR